MAPTDRSAGNSFALTEIEARRAFNRFIRRGQPYTFLHEYRGFPVSGEVQCPYQNHVGSLEIGGHKTCAVSRAVQTENPIPAAGIEPATSSLGNQCSIQLSYAGVWGKAIAAAASCKTFALPVATIAGQWKSGRSV